MSDKSVRFSQRVRMILVGVALAGIAAAASGCAQADGAETPVPVKSDTKRLVRVETMLVTPQEFKERVKVTGVVDAKRDVTISAEAGGRVVEIAELGSRVSTGDVVARFDERVLKSQLEAAQAAYELAEDTYRRQHALYRDSVISALEYENVRARRDQAAATLEQAKKAFADTRLTSPITGRVEERLVETGELVAPGSRVIRVVDTRHVKIRAGVPERYAADIVEGAPVRIKLPALNLEGEAVLSFVGRVVDAKSRTFPVELELENTSVRLKPQMVLDVSIERRSVKDALVVPQTSVVRDDLGTGLFVVRSEGDGNIAVRRDVTLGPSFDGMVVVESGISSGEQIVVVGQSNLTDGNPVEIVST